MLCIPHTTKGITILTNQLILTIILPNYISIPCSIHSQRQGCHKGNPIALDLIETEFSWCREKPSSSICTLALADKVDSLHLQWWQTCKFSTICSGIKSLHTASQGSDTIFWVIGDDSVGYVGDGGGGGGGKRNFGQLIILCWCWAVCTDWVRPGKTFRLQHVH